MPAPHRRRPRLFLLAATLGLLAGPAMAQSGGEVAGSWIGTLDRQGRPVPVLLEVKPAAPGAAAGTLSFGEPDRCSLPLTAAPQEAAGQGKGRGFALGPSNGGRCQDYALGTLSLVPGASGALDFAVTTPRRTPGPQGTVQPAAKAPTSAALAGTWRGQYQGRTGPVPLTLAITDARPGQTAGKLSFGAPDDCVNPLEFSGLDARGATVLTPANSNGGRCVLNVFGTLTLTPTAAGLTAVLVDKSGQPRFSSELRR